MQAYKVVGRAHRRTSMVVQQAIAPDGSRMEIKQAGPMVMYHVGDVIEDIRRDELEAFPDRFVAATAAEVDAWHERQQHLPVLMRAPGLSAKQAEEHAKLTRQIEELQAKQQALLTEATTPVPTELDMEEDEPYRAGRGPQAPVGAPRADAPGHSPLPGPERAATVAAVTAPPVAASEPVAQTSPASHGRHAASERASESKK